ncbi:MAG: lycopene cyclase family protein [Bacteroidota bacterium]
MSSIQADYAIIGAGAAGLQLCLRLLEDPFFAERRILLIDADGKSKNDRTWSYWERGAGRWDHLIWKSWDTARFSAPGFNSDIPLAAYRYKSLRSIDFYRYAMGVIDAAPNVTRILEHVDSLLEDREGVCLNLVSGKQVRAGLVFDSRLPGGYDAATPDVTSIWQHFGGWVVRFDEPVFNPGVFTMMDFNRRYRDTCSFTYILPENAHQGLIEFTFFSPQCVSKSVYEAEVEEYINTHFPGKRYNVVDTEFGVIPMSDYPFHRHHTSLVTRIGTAGGWVKPSTGYSFRNTERYIDVLITNLKNERVPSRGIYSSRHRFYDSLFLYRLKNENASGHELFTVMYKNNPIDRIFRFLDEESSFGDELQIMSTFRPWPFMRIIAQKIGRRLLRLIRP